MNKENTHQLTEAQKADAALPRYNRQLLLPEIGEKGQTLIRRARVLLVGVGGLGSPVSLYLTGAGIGTLGLMDDDVVAATNLHRQVLYSEEQIGTEKLARAVERLSALNSEVNLVSYPYRLTRENADTIISQYDIVVDGTDNFATRFIIDDACRRCGVPYVYGAVRGFEGQASVFNFGENPCHYRDLFPDEEATLAMPHPGKALVGMTPAVVGSVLAEQVLQLVCGYGEPLVGRLWTIDLRTMQSYIIEI